MILVEGKREGGKGERGERGGRGGRRERKKGEREKKGTIEVLRAYLYTSKVI